MKILNEKPPIFDSACKAFGADLINMAFTYGDTIYIPSGVEIGPWIIEHEEVHEKQQAEFEGGAAAWWGKYLRDPEFRLSQELPGYQTQYTAFCKIFKDRNVRAKHRHLIASSLAGKGYGGCGDYAKIMALLNK